MKKQNSKLATQYNGKVEKYLSQTSEHFDWNRKSTREFFGVLDTWLIFGKSAESIEKTRIIEFGCGGGKDLLRLSEIGFLCTGIDASKEMCKAARKLSPALTIHQKDFTKPLGLEKHKYELVFSKWAMQTAPQIDPVYRNAVEMLMRDGLFIFLVVHPFRQFLEKKKNPANYFKKEIVQSEIFNKTIVVEEPSHTLEEYFSPYFTQEFELVVLQEGYEFPAAEQIGGNIYPTHLIVVARKM